MANRSLSNWIESFVEYTQETEPPESYRRWVGIGVVAACLQRKCWFQWHTKLYPNLYIILVGPAGKAQKSTAMTLGREFLVKQGIVLAAEATTREALIRSINDSQRNASDGIIPVYHNSLTIFSSEFTVFLGFKNQQLIMDLCDWFDCISPWRYSTKDKSKRDHISNLWVNIIAATTPETLQASLPPEAIGGGLTSRMIFIYEKKKGQIVHLPPEINLRLFSSKWDGKVAKRLDKLREKLQNDLYEITSMMGEFVVTEEFANDWIKWKDYQEHHPLFENSPLASYDSRRQTHILKLSMVSSAAKSNNMIMDAPDLAYAIQELTKVEGNMMNVFAGVGGSSEAALMAKVIGILAGKGDMKRSELMNIVYYDTGIDGLNRIIATLKQMGRCKFEMIGEGDNRDAVITYIYKEKEKEDE